MSEQVKEEKRDLAKSFNLVNQSERLESFTLGTGSEETVASIVLDDMLECLIEIERKEDSNDENCSH